MMTDHSITDYLMFRPQKVRSGYRGLFSSSLQLSTASIRFAIASSTSAESLSADHLLTLYILAQPAMLRCHPQAPLRPESAISERPDTDSRDSARPADGSIIPCRSSPVRLPRSAVR